MTEYILLLENILILFILLKLERRISKLSVCNHTETNNIQSEPRVFPRDDETLFQIQEMKKGNKTN